MKITEQEIQNIVDPIFANTEERYKASDFKVKGFDHEFNKNTLTITLRFRFENFRFTMGIPMIDDYVVFRIKDNNSENLLYSAAATKYSNDPESLEDILRLKLDGFDRLMQNYEESVAKELELEIKKLNKEIRAKTEILQLSIANKHQLLLSTINLIDSV